MIFSVIIPTYNRSDKIVECVDSVLKQEFPLDKFEVIVVDDGSTDGTYRKLSGFKIKLLRLKKNMGPSFARNFGISVAKGKYLVFTDSDCVVPDNWLKVIHRGYLDRDDVAGVGGGITNPTNSIYARYENYVYRSYIRKAEAYVSKERDEAPFALGNMSYDRKTLLDLGGFSDKYPKDWSGEDAYVKEKFLRRRRKIVYVPINVEHRHLYTFRRFFRQSLERGAGMLFDSIRKGRRQYRAGIFLKIFLTPFYFFYSSVRLFPKIDLLLVDTLFFVFRNIGKLKYYGLVKKVKL